jgi:hypothetical protein
MQDAPGVEALDFARIGGLRVGGFMFQQGQPGLDRLPVVIGVQGVGTLDAKQALAAVQGLGQIGGCFNGAWRCCFRLVGVKLGLPRRTVGLRKGGQPGLDALGTDFTQPWQQAVPGQAGIGYEGPQLTQGMQLQPVAGLADRRHQPVAQRIIETNLFRQLALQVVDGVQELLPMLVLGQVQAVGVGLGVLF